MCLTINTKYHETNEKGYCIPKIAKTDILVFKWLVTNINNTIESPYRKHPMTFNKKGIFKYEREECVYDFGNDLHLFYPIHLIYRGIHSYIYTHYYGISYYYAIIPKGSEYFIGVAGDIVSNNLIVFENEEVYNKYAKTHKVTMVWHDMCN